MSYEGTFLNNKRPVITTAPDCLVYLNGELSLPSGGNPAKRVNIQPLVTSVAVQTGMEQSPGNAQVSMHIPMHHLDDFFRGGQLILTTMMEVRIFMKGHFLVGGAPRYYPVFWGIVTSVNHTWSGGERVVDLGCQDILYWWSIQRITVSPSTTATSKGVAEQGEFNVKGGGYFTGDNPFDIIYSLARHAFGDSLNSTIWAKQARSEPSAAENQRMMYYWTKRMGRIAHSLKMFGPRGDVVQGDLLAAVLSEKNRQAAFDGKMGDATRLRNKKYKIFDRGDVNLAEVASFSAVSDRMGSMNTFVSEFQTKKEIADTVKQTIGYEFYMDVTGEIIFKPPFYNLDVRSNKPVSWVRSIDIINESYAENPADVTFIEGTGPLVRSFQTGTSEESKPRATYADYRLIQKYGWKPGTFNSEFIGKDIVSLFAHLVDELDRQNARTHTGSVTIPIRPELKLGFPIYHEPKDSFYYVENISHQFSYSGQCTTTLTLMAKRSKFYAAFPYWEGSSTGGQQDYQSLGNSVLGKDQPPPSQVADPSVYPSNIYQRPIDPFSGKPVGDKNVILAPAPAETKGDAEKGKTQEELDNQETPAEKIVRNLVSFRNQFNGIGDFNYAFVIDPARDQKTVIERSDDGSGRRQVRGPIVTLTMRGTKRVIEGAKDEIIQAPIFPVSDEGGYEVIGSFAYGRNVQVTRQGFDYLNQGDQRSRALLNMAPDNPTGGSYSENMSEAQKNPLMVNFDEDEMDVTKLDPNNYGRRLSEVQPQEEGYYNYIAETSNTVPNPPSPVPSRQNNPPNPKYNFRPIDRVGRWKSNGVLDQARLVNQVSAQQYPDSVLLSFIQIESSGNPAARRTERRKDGSTFPSQYAGLVQIGVPNAADIWYDETGTPIYENGRPISADRAKSYPNARRYTNNDFEGRDPDDSEVALRSVIHLIAYLEKYKSAHNYDPLKMALVWSGGPGTASDYQKEEAKGRTPEELMEWLRNVPHKRQDVQWGSDRYFSKMQSALSTWGGPTLDQYPTETFETTFEDIPEINDVGRPTEDFEYATRTSTALFARALEDEGLVALPSNIKPIRDPSILPHINTFLLRLYEEAFATETAKERVLRGENQRVLKVPDKASIPTRTPASNRREGMIDSPLGRKEVQEALDRGDSLSEALGQGGVWDTIEKKWKEGANVNTTEENDPFWNKMGRPFLGDGGSDD
jgi:hypothetical protein